jgi:hypothetical protein
MMVMIMTFFISYNCEQKNYVDCVPSGNESFVHYPVTMVTVGALQMRRCEDLVSQK